MLATAQPDRSVLTQQEASLTLIRVEEHAIAGDFASSMRLARSFQIGITRSTSSHINFGSNRKCESYDARCRGT